MSFRKEDVEVPAGFECIGVGWAMGEEFMLMTWNRLTYVPEDAFPVFRKVGPDAGDREVRVPVPAAPSMARAIDPWEDYS